MKHVDTSPCSGKPTDFNGLRGARAPKSAQNSPAHPEFLALAIITAASVLLILAALWLTPDLRCRPGDTRTINPTPTCEAKR